MRIDSCPTCGIHVFHTFQTLLSLTGYFPVQHHGPCGKLCVGGPTIAGEPKHTKNCRCRAVKKKKTAGRPARFTA